MATHLEAFPADPALPQLAIASDPQRMCEVFREHLRPLAGRAYDIQDCVLWRLRYRRAQRCVLQYTLRLVEPRTGRERHQWVTGVIDAEAGGREAASWGPDPGAGRNWGERRGPAPGEQIPEAFMTFEPDAFIADLGMLVQVYPQDRRLPALPLLLGGPPPNLERLLLAELGPGDWQAVAWHVEPARYRAGLAAVLRYELKAREAATGRSAVRRFFVKVYRDDDAGRRTFDIQKMLWEMAPRPGGTRDDRFNVGKPIAYLPELRALIQAQVAGTSLEALMLRGADTAEAVGRVARALAAFNQAAGVAPRLRLLDDQADALQRVGKLLQWACPHLGPQVEAIVGEVAAGLEPAPGGGAKRGPASRVPPGPRGWAWPTHRDLKADHFLLADDHLALLDLDSLAAADPVLDPATLLARFAGMPFRLPLSHEQMQALSQLFTDEYFAHVPRDWRRRLPIQYAGAALHVAAGFFRRQEPRWPEAVAALVGRASDALAGRGW